MRFRFSILAFAFLGLSHDSVAKSLYQEYVLEPIWSMIGATPDTCARAQQAVDYKNLAHCVSNGDDVGDIESLVATWNQIAPGAISGSRSPNNSSKNGAKLKAEALDRQHDLVLIRRLASIQANKLYDEYADLALLSQDTNRYSARISELPIPKDCNGWSELESSFADRVKKKSEVTQNRLTEHRLNRAAKVTPYIQGILEERHRQAALDEKIESLSNSIAFRSGYEDSISYASELTSLRQQVADAKSVLESSKNRISSFEADEPILATPTFKSYLDVAFRREKASFDAGSMIHQNHEAAAINLLNAASRERQAQIVKSAGKDDSRGELGRLCWLTSGEKVQKDPDQLLENWGLISQLVNQKAISEAIGQTKSGLPDAYLNGAACRLTLGLIQNEAVNDVHDIVFAVGTAGIGVAASALKVLGRAPTLARALMGLSAVAGMSVDVGQFYEACLKGEDLRGKKFDVNEEAVNACWDDATVMALNAGMSALGMRSVTSKLSQFRKHQLADSAARHIARMNDLNPAQRALLHRELLESGITASDLKQIRRIPSSQINVADLKSTSRQVGSAQEFVHDMVELELRGNIPANRALADRYLGAFRNDLNMVRRTREIMENGVKPPQKIYQIVNTLMKRMNSAAGNQVVDEYISELRKITYDVLGEKYASQIFFSDWKTVQGVIDLSDDALNSKMDLIRSRFFEKLKDNDEIVTYFGGPEALRREIQTGLAIGTGSSHEAATMAAKMAVIRKADGTPAFGSKAGQVLNFSSEMLNESMDQAARSLNRIPSSFKDSGGLKMDIYEAFRKGNKEKVEEFLSSIPKESRAAVATEVKRYMESINVLDYFPPRLMDPTEASKLAKAVDSGDVREATRIVRQSDPRRAEQFMKAFDPEGVSTVMLFDIKNMGGSNFRAMEIRSREIREHMAARPKSPGAAFDQWEKVLYQKVETALDPVTDDLHAMEDRLKDQLRASGLKDEDYLMRRTGDDITVIVKPPIETNIVMQRMMNATGDSASGATATSRSARGPPRVRASAVELTGRETTAEILSRLDAQTEIIKHFEASGMQGVRVMTVGGQDLVFPPVGADSSTVALFDKLLAQLPNGT